MKKLMSMFLALVVLVMVLSGCDKVASSGNKVTEPASKVSATGEDSKSDGIFVFEGTVITDLTEKGMLEKNIVIPDTVTEIGGNAFMEAEVETVKMGANVTKIDEDAFIGCLHLTTINIPDGVESIGKSAFYQCKALESITIPSSVKTIGEEAFYLCLNLTSITFSEGLETIGEQAFGCTSATTIVLPEGVKSIGDRAFAPCPDTTSIYLPASLEELTGNSLGFDYYAVIYVKEGSWADKNFDSLIQVEVIADMTMYTKAYY